MDNNQQQIQGNFADLEKDRVNYERLNMSFWVDNQTDSGFKVEHFNLEWGKWMHGPGEIRENASRQLPFRSCGRAHSPTGTQGWVKYACTHHQFKFTVKWDIPANGDGYLVIEVEGEEKDDYKLELTHYNPSSSDPNPVLVIRGKK